MDPLEMYISQIQFSSTIIFLVFSFEFASLQFFRFTVVVALA